MSDHSKNLEDALSVTKDAQGLTLGSSSTIHIVSEEYLQQKEDLSLAEKALNIVIDVATKIEQTFEEIITNGLHAFVDAASDFYDRKMFNQHFFVHLQNAGFSF